MIERSGFEDDLAGFDSGMRDGGPEAAMGAITDRFLTSLAAIGTATEAAAVVQRYADSGTTSPCLGGIAKADLDATLEALAGCLG
jgi:hypothetical protein